MKPTFLERKKARRNNWVRSTRKPTYIGSDGVTRYVNYTSPANDDGVCLQSAKGRGRFAAHRNCSICNPKPVAKIYNRKRLTSQDRRDSI